MNPLSYKRVLLCFYDDLPGEPEQYRELRTHSSYQTGLYAFSCGSLEKPDFSEWARDNGFEWHCREWRDGWRWLMVCHDRPSHFRINKVFE